MATIRERGWRHYWRHVPLSSRVPSCVPYGGTKLWVGGQEVIAYNRHWWRH